MGLICGCTMITTSVFYFNVIMKVGRTYPLYNLSIGL